MIHSREVFANSLDHALLANRVVLALDKIQTSGAAANEQEALNDAVNFLELIQKGKDFTSTREISEDSYQAALAYGEAIKAIEQLPPEERKADGDSARVLQNLMSFASALRESRTVSEGDLQALTGFFRRVRDITISAGDRKSEIVKFL